MVVSAVLLAAAACNGGDDSPAQPRGPSPTEAEAVPVFPGAEWEHAEPAALGFDPDQLAAIATEAEAIGSECLLVSRQGRIVGEWYWNGTDADTTHEAYSATKSYTSALVGIAQGDGDLDIETDASSYIPEWGGTPSEGITVGHLLSGTSGLHAPAGFDVIRQPDATAYGIALDQDAPPGTTWANNEPAIQALETILEQATGAEPATFARERLFEPIGAESAAMGRDPSGNTYMFWNLQTTCRDAARFGYLFLRAGNWDGTQVVPEEWVASSTGRSSQDVNPGYGYLWWLNRAGDAAGAEPLVPGAPADTYWALGAFGQVIQVDPGSETVVVRFGAGAEVYDPTARDLTARVVVDAFDG